MKTIVIVEAVATHRESLVYWLKDDYTVVATAQGADGMALAAQHEPDLLFLGQVLPDMESGEVVRRLKGQPRLRDMPIIALMAPVPPGEEAPLGLAGCAAALPTPPDEDQVADVLRSWLGGG